MLDSKHLRYSLDDITQRLHTRGYTFDKQKFIDLEAKRKLLQKTVQTLQCNANTLAKQLGACLKQPNAAAQKDEILHKSRVTKQQLQNSTNDFQVVKSQLDMLCLQLPNVPHATTPIGQSAEDNQCIRTWGEIPSFSFVPKDHVALAVQQLKLMDFEKAAMMSGSRFVVLQGTLARLQRALIQWMLEVHVEEHGYTEMSVPYLVNAASLQSTGQLPSFEKELFKIQAKEDWYLIPTGEVPLTNLGRNHIFKETDLPIKYTAYTPCFRSEAGSYGKDVKGMIRQHQFDKVELVHFVQPSEGLESLEQLTKAAEVILQRLNLPYRVMSLCTGDLGFASSKTYDLEVWLPGQSAFREISSCSYMGDFQAQRLKTRWRCPKTGQVQLVHTLNGSGLAVGRTLVAILENYQKEDGSVEIPSVLRPYMGSQSLIPPISG